MEVCGGAGRFGIIDSNSDTAVSSINILTRFIENICWATSVKTNTHLFNMFGFFKCSPKSREAVSCVEVHLKLEKKIINNPHPVFILHSLPPRLSIYLTKDQAFKKGKCIKI